MRTLAERKGVTPEQLFFRFVMDLGIAPLTGTTNETHMKQDLAVLDMTALSEDEIGAIKREMQLA